MSRIRFIYQWVRSLLGLDYDNGGYALLFLVFILMLGTLFLL